MFKLIFLKIPLILGLNSSPNIDNIEIEAFPQARGHLSSSNIENADEDFPLEANANLLKLPSSLYKANANSSVHISKKKRLRAHNSDGGIITSLNFPNYYPTNVYISDTIPYTSGDFLAIEFTDFDLEVVENAECRKILNCSYLLVP